MFAIESANIVGYTNKDLNATGNTAVGASFVNVGDGNGIRLSDIRVGGVTEDQTINGTINIQVLDNVGNAAAKYMYFQNVKTGINKGKTGWHLGNTAITKDNDVLFAAGQGLWVKGISGASLTTSGQVLFDDVIKELNATGNTMLCNPYPIDIKLAKNISVTGIAEDQTINGTINIQILDNVGNAEAKYVYFQNVKTGINKGKTGWYAGNTAITEDADITIPVGQGLWVKGISGATLTFSLGE